MLLGHDRQRDAVELEVLAIERHRLARPQQRHDLKGLVVPAGSLPGRRAVADLVEVLPDSQTDAEQQTAVGQLVERRRGKCQPPRRVRRRRGDPSAERDLLGPRGDRSERHPRVSGSVADGVADEHAVPACLFGSHGEVDDLGHRPHDRIVHDPNGVLHPKDLRASWPNDSPWPRVTALRKPRPAMGALLLDRRRRARGSPADTAEVE